MNEMKRTANFGDNRPIYLQISGWICEKILRGEWVADQRIPSLRELGVLLEVNPNTVVRTCEYLLSQGVIYNRRGLGYFVSADAGERIRSEARRVFYEQELANLALRMRSLGITVDEVSRHLRAMGADGDVPVPADE